MPTRDEPILGDVSTGTIRPSAQWRCTVPGKSMTPAALLDASLRRGTYVSARTAEAAAQLMVEHEELRPYVRIDVQPWCADDGSPLSPIKRREVIHVRAGRRDLPKPEPTS